MSTGKKIEKIDIDNAVSKLSSFTAPSLMNAYASTPYGIVKIINGKMTGRKKAIDYLKKELQ
jgi:hypothetical protein